MAIVYRPDFGESNVARSQPLLCFSGDEKGMVVTLGLDNNDAIGP